MSKVSKDCSFAKSRNFTDFCMVGEGGGAGTCPIPHNTNICKVSRLFGVIPSLVFEKSLSNLANTLLILLKAFCPAVLSSCRFLLTGASQRFQKQQTNAERCILWIFPTYPVCVIEHFLAASEMSSIFCTFPSYQKYFIYHFAQV